jgi:hypothetical protein
LQVDRGGLHAGMAEPALHEIERHAGADCVKVEAIAQALGCRVRPGRNFGMSMMPLINCHARL